MKVEMKKSPLDSFKLRYEKHPFETKELIVNSAKRASLVRAQLLLKRAEALARHLPKWRMFKRLGSIEAKLDKPFIHESGLSMRVDDLEAALSEFLAKKKVAKK